MNTAFFHYPFYHLTLCSPMRNVIHHQFYLKSSFVKLHFRFFNVLFTCYNSLIVTYFNNFCYLTTYLNTSFKLCFNLCLLDQKCKYTKNEILSSVTSQRNSWDKNWCQVTLDTSVKEGGGGIYISNYTLKTVGSC